MRILEIFIVTGMLYLSGCTNKQGANQSGNVEGKFELMVSLIPSVKEQIYKYACSLDSTQKIFDITIIRLHNKSILYLHPIVYSSYIGDKGLPLTSFEYNDILFLLYTGVESIVPVDKVNSDLIHRAYDSVCSKNNIHEIKGPYDVPPLYLEIKNDSLMPYNDKDARFHYIFFDVQLDTSRFVPFD